MGTKVKISVETKDRTREFERSIRELASMDVLVGVPEDEAGRNGQEPINNAALAFIHDKGSPARNIPARPFFDPGINDVKQEIVKRMKAVGKAALSRSNVNVEKGLHAVGLVAVTGVKNRINTGPFAPLKERTLKARKARGRTGEKPLIDTGQLRNAMNYVVRRKK